MWFAQGAFPWHTIVAANESVAIFGLELAIDVLLGLLHCNVHVAVEAGEHACERESTTQKMQVDGRAHGKGIEQGRAWRAPR